MSEVELCGFWTEHQEGDHWSNSPPISSEVSRLGVGTMLISCGEVPSHFVLRAVGTWEECRRCQNDLNEMGWETFLSRWKAEMTTSTRPEAT